MTDLLLIKSVFNHLKYFDSFFAWLIFFSFSNHCNPVDFIAGNFRRWVTCCKSDWLVPYTRGSGQIITMDHAKLSLNFSWVLAVVHVSNILDVFHTAVSCRARKCSKTRFVCFYNWRLDVSRSHFKNFESLPKIKRFPSLLKAPHSVAFTFPLP